MPVKAVVGELTRLKRQGGLPGRVKVAFTFDNLKDAAEFEEGDTVEIGTAVTGQNEDRNDLILKEIAMLERIENFIKDLRNEREREAEAVASEPSMFPEEELLP